MNKKKIFIIAPSFYGIDKSISKAFEDLGFEAILKNNRTRLNIMERVSKKIMREFPFTKIILNQILRFFLNKENQEYLSSIKEAKPDILFAIKGETLFPGTLKIIKDKMRIPCIAYIWDDPFYSYAGQFSDDFRKNNFASGMHLYDYIFVYDPYYVEEIKKRGITKVSYLPLATDSNKYKKTNLTEEERKEYSYDVTFVGVPYPNRIEILNNLTEFNLGVFGDGWEKLQNSYYKGRAINERVLKIYNSSKIVLNVHDPEAKFSVNTRTFDIPATGAFELVDYKPELENLFKIGEEIVCYKDISDLKRQIRFYLNNPEERQRIAERGRAKVLGSHTWYHRMKKVVEVLENL